MTFTKVFYYYHKHTKKKVSLANFPLLSSASSSANRECGKLRIVLQVLIVSRAHLGDGDPELCEMLQVQPVGVFEDSFLEHRLNFLVGRQHLHDGKVTTNDIKPSEAEENKDIFVIMKLLPSDVVIVKDGVLHNVQIKPCDDSC